MKKRVEILLAAHGMESASIPPPRITGETVTFSGIKLDEKGFSTIDSIALQGALKTVLTGEPFSSLMINALHLSGTINKAGNISIEGWKPAAIISGASAREIILNDARLSLITPAGPVRIEAKGRATATETGNRRIETALWSREKKLTFDTRWTGETGPAGWSAAADIEKLDIETDRLITSRAGGWISFEGKPGSVNPVISGQIEAGLLRIGEKTILNNAQLTLDGTLDSWHLIIVGHSLGTRDVFATADLRKVNGEIQIHAALDSSSLEDLLGFLSDLNDDLQLFSPGISALTTLLITPGNLQRVRNDIKKIDHDRLELVVDGTPYDLTGKIIVKKISKGEVRSSVISMNPALPAAQR